jgi:hypothetical protein
MTLGRTGAVLLVMLALAACRNKTPSEPDPLPPLPPGTSAITGSVFDATSDAPVASATVVIGALGQAVSGAGGQFTLTTTATPALQRVTVTSPTTVERSTWLTAPGSAISLGLMPSSLNLAAYDQMFRANGAVLRRWTVPPVLIIERSVLRFTNTNDPAYVALAPVLSASEADEIRQDLVWALPQLTGGTFQNFADVQIQTTPEGQFVSVAGNGTIVVSRFEGLTASTGFWGYARWGWDGSGAIRSGFVMFDRGFETSGSAFRRSLRSHELGHALGYNHVTAVDSVMGQAARTEPNPFDRAASRVAFARPILNRSPDADPEPGVTPMATGPVTWVGAP